MENERTTSISKTLYLKRTPIISDLINLDDEAFNYLIFQMNQTAHGRGGFRDKVGLADLEQSTNTYIKWLEELESKNVQTRRVEKETSKGD